MNNQVSAMCFLYAFLQHVEENGIFDEYDPDENAMVTSDAMQDLINMAMEIVPDRISNEEAAVKMRNLTDIERDALIEEDEENVVIDLRSEFAQKMSANQGARGVLHKLVEAKSEGDEAEVERLFKLAEEFDDYVS